MESFFRAPITYFLKEGRENLPECLRIAFEAAKQQNVEKIVIFTAQGEGVKLAIEGFCSQSEYKDMRLVAVTFPNGKTFSDPSGKPVVVEVGQEDRALFERSGVPIVRAHLPFDPIGSCFKNQGVLAQDLSLVGNALNMFCGSMSLCVQAIVLACDAGAVELGEHVVAMTSDTAILAQATSTRRMLRELVIREVLCKPAILSIGREELAERPSRHRLAEEGKGNSSPRKSKTRRDGK
ncbi:MAG: hypothetical protein WCF68_18360 [Terriglobales bacterium]